LLVILAWSFNEEPGMHKFTENLSPEDRHVYRRWLGGLVGFYGALMTVTAGVIAGDQWSKNLAREPAVAAAVNDRLVGPVEDWMVVRHVAK
jgi:hypothetical protein